MQSDIDNLFVPLSENWQPDGKAVEQRAKSGRSRRKNQNAILRER